MHHSRSHGPNAVMRIFSLEMACSSDIDFWRHKSAAVIDTEGVEDPLGLGNVGFDS